MGKLRVYCLKTLNKLSIYPLGNTPSAPSEGGALIGIEVVTGEFAASHPTDGVNKVTMVEIFEPVLIRVMGVGAMVEVHRRRVFPTFLVTSVL